jgi:nucleotide-binding universal stress UspA family protein
MYKRLLVHIPTERSARAAIDASISFALTCGAHVDAVATGFETTFAVSPLAAEGGAAVAAVYEADHELATERANAALRLFEFEAKAAGISYDCRALTGTFFEVTSMLGPAARLHDLTIVSQPEAQHGSSDNRLPQELLVQCGGPVLFVPYTFHGAFSAARIGICWDGSRLAARALRDAMPLVSRADALTVITINGDKAPAEASQDRLIKYLANIGLPAKAISLDADHANIQPAILSIAADESLDLLVMGGYGHSHLQEFVLGGVTREMFRSMTVPTLMSH